MIKEIKNKIIADYIHNREEPNLKENTVKSFAEIHQLSPDLDHSFSNDEHHAIKYTISKGHNILMVISQEHIIQRVIANLEKNILITLSASNLSNFKDNTHIIRKPLKLHLIKKRND